MRRSYLAITLAALASGGAALASSTQTSIEPDGAMQAIDKAYDDWEKCTDTAINNYDDRTSDVISVATAVQFMCSNTYIVFLQQFPSGPHDIGVAQQARVNLSEVIREIAAKVLVERASRPHT